MIFHQITFEDSKRNNQSLAIIQIICILQMSIVILPLNRLLISILAIPKYFSHDLCPFNMKYEYTLHI